MIGSQILNQSDLSQREQGEQDQSLLEMKISNEVDSNTFQVDYSNQVGIKINDDSQQKQKLGDQDISLLNISVLMQNCNEDNGKFKVSQNNYQKLLSSTAKQSIEIQDSGFETTIRRSMEHKDKDGESSCQEGQNELKLSKSNSKQLKQKPFTQVKSEISLYANKSDRRRANILQSEGVQNEGVWQRKWMQIFYYISKFRKIAREYAIFYRPHMLKKNQVHLIGDQGSSQQYQSSLQHHTGTFQLSRQFSYQNFSKYMTFRNYRKMIKCIIKYFGWLFYGLQKIYELYQLTVQLIFQHLPLFHYLSYPYILWETIIFICSTILFIYIPFEFSFQIERNYFFSLYFTKICPIIYGIDIFIRANTKSTETGPLVENHIQIFNKYFKTEMIPDILSILCLNYQILNFQATYFFFFYRITKSFRILDIFKEQFLLRMKISGIISLIYLAAQVIYFAHLICCVWNGVGQYEVQLNQGWIIKYDTLHSSIQIRYLRSFYYSVITMTTIGYGDYTPQSDIEKLTVILLAFISCGVFGYSINSIGSILYDFKQKRNIYLQGLAMTNKYFKQYDVDLELQARARKYLDYVYTDKKEDLLCSIDQLSNLTEYLQDEIKANVYTKRLKNIKIFNDLFSKETLTRIALKMSEKILSHDQDIIHITSLSEPSLCIVHSGVVIQYVYNEKNKKVKEIKNHYEGQYFGLENFIQETYYSEFNFKSHGICCVLQISLSDFLEEIKKNTEEYEKYCFIRDEVKFNNNLRVAGLSCQSCQQKHHTMKTCPFIFYEGKKETILRRYFQNINKQIQSFKRDNQQRKFRSILKQQTVSKEAERYMNDYENNHSESDISSNNDNQNEEHTQTSSSDQEQSESSIQKQKSLVSQKSIKSYISQKSIGSGQKLSIFNSDSLSYIHVPNQHNRLSSTLPNHTSQQNTNKIQSIQEEPIQPSIEMEVSLLKNSKPVSINPQKKSVTICEDLNENEIIENNINMYKMDKRDSERSSLLQFANPHQSKERHSQISSNISQLDIAKQANNSHSNKSTPIDSTISQIQSLLEQIVKDKRKPTISAFDKRKMSIFLQRQHYDLSTNQDKSYFPALTQLWESQLFIYDFEIPKIYTFYYPDQNYLQIVDQENLLKNSRHLITQFKKQVQKQIATFSSKGKERNSSFYFNKNSHKL